MYDTGGFYSVCREPAVADPHLSARLNWLRAEIERGEWRARLLRGEREEREMMLMSSPVPTHEAFAVLGALLGLVPPAVIFFRLFRYGLDSRFGFFWFLLCLGMNAVCFAVGRALAGRLGRRVDDAERRSWPRTILWAAAFGALWGIATGAAGGAVVFGVGALAGAIMAVPVGLVAFTLFVPLHRLLARGGMIDERHLWPLACGVTGVLAATVLGL